MKGQSNDQAMMSPSSPRSKKAKDLYLPSIKKNDETPKAATRDNQYETGDDWLIQSDPQVRDKQIKSAFTLT